MLCRVRERHPVLPDQFRGGFTFIELMVVLMITALLLSLAAPAYREAVFRAGRSEAHTLLLRVATVQERHRSSHQEYSQFADPFSDPPQTSRWSPNDRYRVEIRACTGVGLRNCFVAVAIPLGPQAQDSCGELQLWSSGRREASGGSNDSCW